jgi:hypothetical protein
MLCRNNKDRFYRFYRFFKKERENNYRTLREIILPAGPLCGDVSACGIVAFAPPASPFLARGSHAATATACALRRARRPRGRGLAQQRDELAAS